MHTYSLFECSVSVGTSTVLTSVVNYFNGFLCKVGLTKLAPVSVLTGVAEQIFNGEFSPTEAQLCVAN